MSEISRGRRGRDDGRGDRPARAGGTATRSCSTTSTRRRSSADEPASARDSRGGRPSSISTPTRSMTGSTAGWPASGRPRPSMPLGAQADIVIEAALEDLDLKQDDLPGAGRGEADPDAILATNTSALRSPRRGAGDASASASSDFTSSTRRRSCRSSRSSSPPTTGSGRRRAGGARWSDSWGKTPGPLGRSAGLHRQPRQPAVHARGAADARGRRGVGRGDR